MDELERLEKNFARIQKEEADKKVSLKVIMEHLKELGINSIEEANKFVDTETKEINKKEKKKKELISQIKTLFGKWYK